MIPHPLAVGLTGGIGSGKTLIASMFAALGTRILSADDLAKNLVDTNQLLKSRIQREFGSEIYTNENVLNRKRLARTVFHDPSALQRLNQIVHPLVLQSIRDEIVAFKQEKTRDILMVEAALLFEANAESMFDYILVVDADEEERIHRIIARDKCSKSEIHERIKAQMPVSEKITKADFVIRNMGDQKMLKEKCLFIYTLLHIIAQGS